ncbi:hypothetical protein Nepgr_018942 [Nepenthes gracilis]|uniref:Uncharacterized protein n=1 Tax=Nepenthes gracilis TaxID=150966 RepID=A0AAD3XUU1_NEPGR|nr:hypothetical protein Nepgr_018942 [Nepenthes gracilis]
MSQFICIGSFYLMQEAQYHIPALLKLQYVSDVISVGQRIDLTVYSLRQFSEYIAEMTWKICKQCVQLNQDWLTRLVQGLSYFYDKHKVLSREDNFKRKLKR